MGFLRDCAGQGRKLRSLAVSGVTALKKNAGVFHQHFTSDPAVVAGVLMALGEVFQEYSLREGVVSSIEIVLSEVINNINEHAYRGAPDGPVELHAAFDGSDVLFQIVDSGIEMPGGRIPPRIHPDVTGPLVQLPEGGFGWCLIHDLAHDLNYRREKGENRFSFRVTIDGALAT
jgi:serine/threonine-protein kinase RsbW